MNFSNFEFQIDFFSQILFNISINSIFQNKFEILRITLGNVVIAFADP